MRHALGTTIRGAVLLSLGFLCCLYGLGKASAVGVGNKTMAGAGAPDQSGYWAQVTVQDATVLNRAGGSVVLKTLTRGQWFHVYATDRTRPSWFLGYACPHGNRGCSNVKSIAGYILRTSFSGRAAADVALPIPGADDYSYRKMTLMLPMPSGLASIEAAPLASANPAVLTSERLICARDVYLRDNKLHLIAILRHGDHFKVERYTDSGWAIGIGPKNMHGRVIASALCP